MCAFALVRVYVHACVSERAPFARQYKPENTKLVIGSTERLGTGTLYAGVVLVLYNIYNETVFQLNHCYSPND